MTHYSNGPCGVLGAPRRFPRQRAGPRRRTAILPGFNRTLLPPEPGRRAGVPGLAALAAVYCSGSGRASLRMPATPVEQRGFEPLASRLPSARSTT
jgi:hypothetical protein